MFMMSLPLALTRGAAVGIAVSCGRVSVRTAGRCTTGKVLVAPGVSVIACATTVVGVGGSVGDTVNVGITVGITVGMAVGGTGVGVRLGVGVAVKVSVA